MVLLMRRLAIVLLIFLSVVRLRADVEYSNLGPNDTSSAVASAVTGPMSGFGTQTLADEFTASFTGVIDAVDVAAFNVAGSPLADVNIELNDPITNLPLSSSRFFLGTISPPNGTGLFHVVPNDPYLLTAGTPYWIELMAHDPTTADGWPSSLDRNANPSATSTDSGATYSVFEGGSQAFRVTAVAVPESSTLVAGLLCALTVIARLIRLHGRSRAPKGV